ncbi:MAG TPA: hypothetical protein VJR27_03830 [Candidatus Saccharimonadales bacterium]|nr:hypothetical protein [Candidatus Saccharimonadales bacterium]
MGLSNKTKAIAVAGTAGLAFAAVGANKIGLIGEHDFTPTLTQETTDALHNGGKGFSTLFLHTQDMAKPVTPQIIDEAVGIMQERIGDKSSEARALGYCSIALANELWQHGTGPTRQKVIQESAAFSFENGAKNMPPTLADDCRRVDVELLPAVSVPIFPVPSDAQAASKSQ